MIRVLLKTRGSSARDPMLKTFYAGPSSGPYDEDLLLDFVSGPSSSEIPLSQAPVLNLEARRDIFPPSKSMLLGKTTLLHAKKKPQTPLSPMKPITAHIHSSVDLTCYSSPDPNRYMLQD